jgi:energy-coupling factor transport system permease protein
MYDVKKLLEPSLQNTLIHRIDPRAKLIVLAAFSITAIAMDNPKALTSLFILSFIGYPVAKIPAKNIKILVVLLCLLIWGTIYSQALFYQQHPRTIIFTILPENSFGMHWDGLHMFREGMEYGAIQSMRFAATTSLALLFYWTTQPNALLFGLIRLKVPYGLAFMVMTALRFIPLLFAESITVFRAQRLKGYMPFTPVNWIKTVFLALVPILANCIRRAAKLAVSVEGRAFKPDAARTYLKADILTFTTLDRVLVALCLTAVPVLVFKILFWLYVNDIYYLSQLRWVYEIVGRYI